MQLGLQQDAKLLVYLLSRLGVLCTLGLLPLAAHCVNPNRRITQYGHVAWRLQDGVFTGSPQAMAQTADGYVWIGTSNGLFRFDGQQFKPFRNPSGQQLTSEIVSMMAAKDGSLWFTSGSSLQHLHDGVSTQYREESSQRRANTVIQDKEGGIWVTFSRRPFGNSLCRVEGTRLRCYGATEGVPLLSADHLAEDAGGALWVSAAEQLEKWSLGHGQTFSPPALSSVAGLSGFSALCASPDGSMWVGVNQEGAGLGLQHVNNGKWSPITFPGFDSTRLRVSALMQDRQGSLWIGTETEGLYRLKGERVDHYVAANGLSGDSVSAIIEDREGDIWVATSRGLDKFRNRVVATFSMSEGLASDVVDSVAAASDGSIWSGAGGYLEHIQHGKVVTLGRNRGLPGAQVTSLLEDHLMRLWVGVDNKLFMYSAGEFTVVNKSGAAPTGIVFDLAEDTAGGIWAITPYDHALYRVSPTRVTDALPTPGNRQPRALKADKHGGLWVSFDDGGLSYYKDGSWAPAPSSGAGKAGMVDQMVVTRDDSVLGRTRSGLIGWHNGTPRKLGIANGLPCQETYSLVLDQQGALWAYAQCGLFSISESELQRWWQRPDARLQVRVLDNLDGVEPGSATFRPRSALAADGTVWFANGTVLQQVDPLDLNTNPLRPSVFVESVTADRKQYSLKSSLNLPALARDIQIDYTALSFPIPERVRFRYRLDGWDKDWQDASNRRQAFYTNLRPGSYRFHVIACNSDGLWNESGATLDFSIDPRYYQTAWFQILCALILILLAWSLYLLRLRQATVRIQERLGARLEERERIARELHDTLLQGVQGLMLRFQGIMKTLPADQPTHKMMNDALDRADELMLQARQGVKNIRAAGIAEGDLPDMIKACAEELQQDHAAALKLTFAGTPRPLDVTVCTEVYRIVREAMTNAFQHSGAPNIEVEVTYQPEHLRVSVRDDGQGIEPQLLSTGKSGHWGLSGMRERTEKVGARLRILSQRAAGTEIELTVPGRLAYARTNSPSFWDKIKGRNSKEDHL